MIVSIVCDGKLVAPYFFIKDIPLLREYSQWEPNGIGPCLRHASRTDISRAESRLGNKTRAGDVFLLRVHASAIAQF